MYRKDLKVLVHRKHCIFKSIKVLSDYQKVNGKYQFNSIAQSRLTLSNPLDCSTPGFTVHHQLPELAQTHIQSVSDAIQPSHPLSSPSPPALNLSQHQVFSNESVLHIMWPKYWSFSFSISPSNEYSGMISFRIDWFDLLAVQGTLVSNRREVSLYHLNLLCQNIHTMKCLIQCVRTLSHFSHV